MFIPQKAIWRRLVRVDISKVYARLCQRHEEIAATYVAGIHWCHVGYGDMLPGIFED